MKKLLYILLLLPCLMPAQGASGWLVKSFDNTVPSYADSIFIEGEHFSLNGAVNKAYRFGYSNDTAAANMNTNSSNYIYRTVTQPHDSIYVVAKVNTAGTLMDVLLNGVVEVNDYSIPASGNPIGFGIPITIAQGDAIRIRSQTNFIEVDYVIFYYQYE